MKIKNNKKGYCHIGGIIGEICTGSVLRSGTARGTIIATFEGGGGVIGHSRGTVVQISQVYSTSQVNVYSPNNAGGIIGCNTGAISMGIDNVYTNAKLFGSKNTGGIFGTSAFNTIQISNSYSCITSNATVNSGMIVGNSASPTTSTNVFYCNETMIPAIGT